jgi:serine phosphatase RsbU (regulator of sigma subunit)
MHLLEFLTVSLSVGLASAAAAAADATHPKFFTNRAIFTPPQGTKASYPRITELSDGTILATIAWKDPKVGLAYFPIFQSKDDGWTWKHISNLTDQVNGLGLGSQPALAELPCKLSDMSTMQNMLT